MKLFCILQEKIAFISSIFMLSCKLAIIINIKNWVLRAFYGLYFYKRITIENVHCTTDHPDLTLKQTYTVKPYLQI